MNLRFTLLSLFFTLFLSTAVFAQDGGEIYGQVVDENGEPMPFATVVAYAAEDSAMAKAGYSDNNGNFRLVPLADGEYFLRVTYTGYARYSGDLAKAISGRRTEYPKIKMAQSGSELEEVKIVAERPMVSVKPDMLVFNVENTPNAIGENAFNLLRKAPGVVIDNNDNIMLLGKSGLRIYIDGKPSPLTAQDLANMLKSVQSDQIESIEIITNPSSKYDAEGNAGIINIRMKRDKNLGGNATINLGYAIGIYSKYNGSISANYRGKKVSLFGTYGLSTGKSQNFMEFYRVQSGLNFTQNSAMIQDYDNHNFRAGLDVNVGKNSTIGVLATGFISVGDWSNKTTNLIANDTTNQLLSLLDGGAQNETTNNNLNYNLNYKYDNGKGTSLNADADYGTYRITNLSYQPNRYLDPYTGALQIDRTFTSDAPTNIDIGTFKLDYEHPLAKGKFGAGGKVSYVKTDNNFSIFDVVNGENLLDSSRSNQFEYTENVNAAYVNYQGKVKKFGYQAGLRAEQTNSDGVLTALVATNNNRVERHYLNLFPSAGLTYQHNQMNVFSLTYSRRIDRPRYQDLNPFEYKLDELSYRKGNPFLRPQYTNNIQLSHTYKYTLNTSLSYAVTTDFFTNITDTTEGTRNFLTTDNLSTRKVATINVSYPYSITKWWSTFTNVSAYNVSQKANFGDGKIVDIARTTASVYHQSNFKLPKDFSLQFSGFYTSPGIWGANFRNRRFWGMDVGAQKNFLKGKANLKMTVSDILFTMQWSGNQTYGGLYMEGRGGWESRQFKVNFTYAFGNNQVKVRKRQTGLDDEKDRANGGGGQGR